MIIDTKPAPGFEGYFVTSDGRVLSTWRSHGAKRVPGALHQIQTRLNSSGYPSVRLRRADGIKRSVQVHILVAIAFIGPRPSPKHEVRHLDGIRTHSVAGNLAWGTRKENAADRVRHGNQHYGQPKLTPEQVRFIRERLASGDSTRSLAREFKVNPTTIFLIKSGATWKRV